MAGYWRAAGWLLGIAAVLYAALLGGMYAFQRNLLYRPDTSKPDWTDLDLPTLQEIELIASDGVRLFAWYVPPSAGRPVIVYFHGNGGNIADRADRMLYFAAAQFGVLIVEYRGYGGNPGSPSEAGLFADARAGLDFLKSERIASGRIVLYGESLGTGVAVRMASERPVALLLLESPYASMAAVAQRHYPYVPVGFLLRDRFDSLSRIGMVRAPILVMHGERDGVVPVQSGRALFAAAPEPKEIWVAPAGGHNDLVSFGALSVAVDFIRRHTLAA